MPNGTLSLYDLDHELQSIEADLLEAGGVIDEDMEERLDSLLEKRSDKIEGYLAVIRHYERTAEAVEAERKRLQKRERSLKNSAQALKDRLTESMLQRGDDSYETDLGKVNLQQASRRSVNVVPEPDQLPERFRRVRTSADKTAIREALESEDAELRAEAEAVAHLEEPSWYVRIY